MSVAKSILIGNLGKDPEIRYTQNGVAIGSFSVATTEFRKTKEETKAKITHWHKVICFGKTAELVSQYLKKGSKVYVEGTLGYREYMDKENIKRRITEITARDIQFLDSKPTENYEPKPVPQPPVKQQSLNMNPEDNFIDDDIPF